MGSLAPSPAVRYESALRYTDRRSKAAYIAEKYGAILGGTVLDVGCDEAPLRALVGRPERYVGVDVRADADVRVNLDRENLPFADGSYETVVCTDVLEHLERCHEVFDELCRVASERVIVSLPNPLRNLLMSLVEGSAGRIKYYGLPVERPPDRHRWFFGNEEASEFLRERGARRGFIVEQMDSEEGGCPAWRNKAGEDLLASMNVRGGTLWCVLRRGGR